MQPEEQKPTNEVNENLNQGTAPATPQSGDNNPVTELSPQIITPTKTDPTPSELAATVSVETTDPAGPAIVSESLPAENPESVAGEPSQTAAVDTPTVTGPVSEVSNGQTAQQGTAEPVATDTTAPAAVVAGATTTGGLASGGKSKRKIWLLAGIIAAAVLLIAGAASAYYMVIVPSQSSKITQDVITNTLDNKKFTSGTFEGELGISGGQAGQVISSVGFEAASDNEKGAFDAKITVNTAVAKINLDARSTDGKSYYVKLSGLNGLDKLIGSYAGALAGQESAAQYSAILSQVNNQWFVIDQSLLSQVPGIESLGAGDSVSPEDAKRIGEMYKKHPFMTVNERLDDEKIHGVDSYHIKATIDKEQLKAFLSEVKAANIKGAKVDQSMIDDLGKADFGKYPFELWIAKKERVLTQFVLNFDESGSSYKLRIALKDINKSVTVEQPKDAKSILELMGGLSPMLMGGGSSSSAFRL